MARQVSPVGESGRQCDLGQGPPVTLRGDHLPGVPQPAQEQVLMGRAAHRQPKYLHKWSGLRQATRAAFFIVTRSAKAAPLIEPSRPVFQNPIEQGAFKTYVVANPLALDPFVTKDLLAFG